MTVNTEQSSGHGSEEGFHLFALLMYPHENTPKVFKVRIVLENPE